MKHAFGLTVVALIALAWYATRPEQISSSTDYASTQVVEALKRIRGRCAGQEMGIQSGILGKQFAVPERRELKCEEILDPVVTAIENNKLGVNAGRHDDPNIVAFFEPPIEDWAQSPERKVEKGTLVVPFDSLVQSQNDPVLIHETVHAYQWLERGKLVNPPYRFEDETAAFIVEGHYLALLKESTDSPVRRNSKIEREAMGYDKIPSLADDPHALANEYVAAIYGDPEAFDALQMAEEKLYRGTGLTYGEFGELQQHNRDAVLLPLIQEIASDLSSSAETLLSILERARFAQALTAKEKNIVTAWLEHSGGIVAGVMSHSRFRWLSWSQKEETGRRKIREVNQTLQTSIRSPLFEAISSLPIRTRGLDRVRN